MGAFSVPTWIEQRVGNTWLYGVTLVYETWCWAGVQDLVPGLALPQPIIRPRGRRYPSTEGEDPEERSCRLSEHLNPCAHANDDGL